MFLVYLFRHCQSSRLLSLPFSYLHTTINLPISQSGSRRIASRISDFRPVSVIAFLYLLCLIFQHTLNFVAHGFLAVLDLSSIALLCDTAAEKLLSMPLRHIFLQSALRFLWYCICQLTTVQQWLKKNSCHIS